MRKPLLFLGMIFLFAFSAVSQKMSTKYGNVTEDELNMNVYPKDSSANAVVLYQDVYTEYRYTQADFALMSVFKKKIKILTTDGCNKADIVIPYYCPAKTSGREDDITGIEAFAYNLENGKIKKEKMDKSLIFDERMNDNWKQVKFSIPSVKAGTVIEYKYTLNSELYQIIPDWIIQHDIPVVHSHYEVLIPEFFLFNVETRGYYKIDVKETTRNQSFSVRTEGSKSVTVPSQSRNIHFTMEDVPALKDDPFVWCANDYVSRVIFELHGVNFGSYKPITKGWKEIEELLAKESDFGDKLKMPNPYRDEMKALPLSGMNEGEKLSAIYNLLKTKLKWNGKYAFYGNGVKEAVKNGIGNNADINFVLISALREAGLKAYPVLLSRRNMGRLPLTYPSLNKLNTFVVGVQTSDGRKSYIDGSSLYGGVNTLGLPLLVDRAREYGNGDEGEWVDLTGIGRNRANILVEAKIASDGTVSGKIGTVLDGQMAYAYKENYASCKDSSEYREKQEADKGIKIISLSTEGMDPFTSTVKESMTFIRSTGTNDNYIYLTPILFPHISKNPFIQEERMLPVEFSYPYQFRSSYLLDIPQGYSVEELPEPMELVVSDGACRCVYAIQQHENQIRVNYAFMLNRVLFSQLEYPELRKAWEALVAKNKEQIVLKKI